MVRRARDEGLYFNTCTITSVRQNLARRQASIGRMIESGLKVTLNTDDPAMFQTTLCREYELAAQEFGFTEDQLRELARNSFEASFLAVEKKLRFLQQIDALV